METSELIDDCRRTPESSQVKKDVFSLPVGGRGENKETGSSCVGLQINNQQSRPNRSCDFVHTDRLLQVGPGCTQVD